jgi:hypothetical protein
MTYLVVVAFGLVCGFLAPQRRSAAAIAFISGVVALAIGIILGVLFSYSADQLTGMLVLDMDTRFDPMGFMPLVGVSYVLLISALVSIVRTVFREGQHDSDQR